jgi:hypothetical protein
VLVGAAGIASVGAGAVGAQVGERVVIGLGAVAQSDGIGSTFGDPEAQPYPVAAGQIAHTEATLSTGPSGYALASTAWPGPLAANAGSLIVLLGGPPEAGQANYGGRAEAFSAGPNDAELPGMRAHAAGEVAEAAAGAQDVTGQPGVTTGDVSTVSRSAYEAGTLSARSSCTASDLGFAEGAVAIGSVRTEASSSTDGSEATAAGRTVVSGLTVGGQPAEVDEEGVRFTDPVTAPVGEQILSQLGMELFVAAPRAEQEASSASYRAGPLVLVWEPPDSGQRFVYSICGSDSAVSLRTGEAFSPPDASTPASLPTAGPAPGRGPSAAPAVARAPGAPGPTAAPPAGAPAPVALDEVPAAFVRDLAWWPYLLGAACIVAAAAGLRRAHDLSLAPRAVVACPLEGGRP